MSPKPEPNLMRLYLRHCLIGFALSAVFVGLVLWYDVGGLGRLVMGSDIGILAVFLLWFFNGTIFGSVQFAIVIMSQADDDDDNDDDGPRRGILIPIKVPVRKKRRAL